MDSGKTEGDLRNIPDFLILIIPFPPTMESPCRPVISAGSRTRDHGAGRSLTLWASVQGHQDAVSRKQEAVRSRGNPKRLLEEEEAWEDEPCLLGDCNLLKVEHYSVDVSSICLEILPPEIFSAVCISES